MSKIIEDIVSDWNGYTEEYPDWLNSWLEAALIGFGLSCLVFLFTVMVCSGI